MSFLYDNRNGIEVIEYEAIFYKTTQGQPRKKMVLICKVEINL